MKTTHFSTVGIFIFVIVFSCCFLNVYAQQTPETKQKAIESSETKQEVIEAVQKTNKSAPRRNFVKVANFYLKNGNLVFGKVIENDKNKITVERLSKSKIVVSTYSKRRVDGRTLNTKNVPDFKYYMDLGAHFSGRTWDFKDDADDFIQAIRCYEKAKQLMQESQPEKDEKIEQVNKEIEHLRADREHWIRETQSRAELRKLEFEAEFEAKLGELHDEIKQSSDEIKQSIEKIESIVVQAQDNHQKLERATYRMSEDISSQLGLLRERIDSNRELIDYVYYYWLRYPPRGWIIPQQPDNER